MRIDTTAPSAVVGATLREAGIGPFHVIALTSLLTSSSTSHPPRRDVWEAATRVGEAFWRLDDLCDAFEDLDTRAWNSLWLEMARRGVGLLDGSARPRTAALLAALREARMAEAVANDVVDALTIEGRVEALEMLSWAWSWVTD